MDVLNISARLQREKELPTPPLQTPFEHIALAFSGGGFRAAAYALGTLSCFQHLTTEDDVPLLQKVRYLSSASGGSICTLYYALQQKRGVPFSAFYAQLHEALAEEGLLHEALRLLNDPGAWTERPHKRRNLINAFALAYDRRLFEHATFATLSDSQAADTGHLEELCVNATEFYRGLPFRQQVKLKPDPGFRHPPYGNFIVNLPERHAADLLLGDLLAASSCFPGGFEPIVFPEDFHHGNLSLETLRNALHLTVQTDDEEERTFRTQPSLGLMDGGIGDNQGLESMMLADLRRKDKKTTFKRFDFLLVNDVGSHFANPYRVPEPKIGGLLAGLTFIGLGWLLLGFLLVSSVLLYLAVDGQSAVGTVLASFVALASLSGLAVGFFLGRYFRKQSRSTTGFNLRRTFGGPVTDTLFGFLRHTPLRLLWQMLKARGNSLLQLNTELFLKRIRQLLYDSFYKAPIWVNRAKGNHIYDLSASNRENRKAHTEDAPDLSPSPLLERIAETAFGVPTTLWFDPDDQKRARKQAAVVAAGQFTTCYNLLLYIRRLRTRPSLFAENSPTRLSETYHRRLDHLQAQLETGYMRFQEDPFWLYNEQGRSSGLPGFVPVNAGQFPKTVFENRTPTEAVQFTASEPDSQSVAVHDQP